jgi:uncharacterized protein DUF1566
MTRRQGTGLLASTVLAFVASSTGAQTTASGPYYPTPSWDQTLAPSTRFIVLSNMNSAAVLDRETGLVWEKSPSTSAVTWRDAQLTCNALFKGNRLGWRLPTLQELASLADPTQSNPPNPALPAGHPFQNVQRSIYWSATTDATLANLAWAVGFDLGDVGHGDKSSNFLNVWCVRGGQGVDPQ